MSDLAPAAGSSGRRAQSPLKSSLRYTVAVEAAATTDSILGRGKVGQGWKAADEIRPLSDKLAWPELRPEGAQISLLNWRVFFWAQIARNFACQIISKILGQPFRHMYAVTCSSSPMAVHASTRRTRKRDRTLK